MEKASKAAKKANQNILLIVTAEGDVDYDGNDFSTPFMNNVVRTEDFKKLIQSEFTVALMDFSESTYKKTVVTDDLSSKEKKQAKKIAKVKIEPDVKKEPVRCNDELICIGNHEQYFFDDYMAYEPDYAARIYEMAKILIEDEGRECIFIEDLAKMS